MAKHKNEAGWYRFQPPTDQNLPRAARNGHWRQTAPDSPARKVTRKNQAIPPPTSPNVPPTTLARSEGQGQHATLVRTAVYRCVSVIAGASPGVLCDVVCRLLGNSHVELKTVTNNASTNSGGNSSGWRAGACSRILLLVGDLLGRKAVNPGLSTSSMPAQRADLYAVCREKYKSSE